MLKRYLTDEEQHRLLAAARGTAGPLAARDGAWMRLLIETGMRVNELATLTAWQARTALAQGWLLVDKAQRKGKRADQAYLVTQPVRACLELLLALHEELRPALVGHLGAAPPLIWGRCGLLGGVMRFDHISKRSLQARMAHWAGLAGLPTGVSPHWLRHTRGVNIVQRCRGKNPLKVVQQALGHVSIASTGIYMQMSREEYTRELHQVAGGRMPLRDVRAMALAEVTAAGVRL